ncbi:MAG: hypothetical protein KIT16_24400, partial [Rhodospirillaceae bacterium]|nr:hypothetical protein [Rhodospirillaceae bacterium]
MRKTKSGGWYRPSAAAGSPRPRSGGWLTPPSGGGSGGIWLPFPSTLLQMPIGGAKGKRPPKRRGQSAFRARDWDPGLHAAAFAADFLASDGRKWSVAAPDARGTTREIAVLQRKKTQRNERMTEIVEQADAFHAPFFRWLTFDAASHPATFEAMEIGYVLGFLAVMRAKAQHSRVRPSQLDPTLFPPLPVPGHASYPSGHATQSMLMALCLGAIREDALPELKQIALRIGENREVAGLHYPSDSAAGRRLAEDIFAALTAHK